MQIRVTFFNLFFPKALPLSKLEIVIAEYISVTKSNLLLRDVVYS